MKLENGKDGPLVSVYKDFHCEVNEVVFGPWELEKRKTLRLRHSMHSAAQYDARGKVTAVVSYVLPHSGLETSLKVGDEFLAFLSEGSGGETEPQVLYRAEKLERREQVLATIAQEKAWALFQQKHAALAKSVLLAGFDAKSRRLALLVGTEGRPVYLVDPTEGTIRTAMSYLSVPVNQIYFDEAHVVLRHNDESPRPIPLVHFK